MASRARKLWGNDPPIGAPFYVPPAFRSVSPLHEPRPSPDKPDCPFQQRPWPVLATDCLAAAATFGVKLVEHQVAIERAMAAIGKLGDKLTIAQEKGLLAKFNQSYRMHRLGRKAQGLRYMNYSAARAGCNGHSPGRRPV